MEKLNKTDSILKTDENKIKSNDFSLKKLLNYNQFIQLDIPLYQRLYVWEVEEIKLFLEDISDAFLADQVSYYIGNMMFVVKSGNENDNIVIDLIDGQQRFTTLWLTSVVLSLYSQNLKSFTFRGKKARLRFTSRKKVNEFFDSLENKSIDILSGENAQFQDFDASLEPLTKGLATIINSMKEIIGRYKWKEKDIKNFSDYIYNNLVMVQTTVPAANNLNQIFESLNSGGKQLENHQILKSRFFKILRKDNRLSEEKINDLVYKWDACSNMNMYLERSVYSLGSKRWNEVIKTNVINDKANSNLANDYFEINNCDIEKHEPISLLSILENTDKIIINEKKVQNEDSKSIISFSQFLLHTLRVFNLIKEKEDALPIDSKNLLKYFDVKAGDFLNAEYIKEFIELLFDLRFLFDRFVIKWTSEFEENQDSLLINKAYYNRSDNNISVKREFVESNRELSLAQSILYIVQEFKTQYWITPFLYHLYEKYYIKKINENYDEAVSSAVSFIENLDKYFYCQSQQRVMAEVSFVKFDSYLSTQKAGDYDFVYNELRSLKGTFFFRYWFYKTEYLLWKNRMQFKDLLDTTESELWEKFKITFKRSIEHIFPQSKTGFENNNDLLAYEIHEEREPILKDYFGNLVLLTESENSEYGNMEPIDKRTKYNTKLSKNYIDSLKSSLIFNLVNQDFDFAKKGIWNYQKAKYHIEKQILPLYNQHILGG